MLYWLIQLSLSVKNCEKLICPQKYIQNDGLSSAEKRMTDTKQTAYRKKWVEDGLLYLPAVR